jgi:hypothetical protein
MKELAILAASFISPEGYGNDLTGLTPWSGPLAEAIETEGLKALHWKTLFRSEQARFGRMDLVSRLGIMAVELLDARLESLAAEERDEMGICVETRTGCIATDLAFLEMPLASTFAYTLPSTVIGEICIRHRFRGPVACVMPLPGRDGALETVRGWLARDEARLGIGIACDVADKKIAPDLWPLQDAMVGSWESSAVLIGWRTGASREHLWQPDSLSRVARSLCASPTTRPTTALK